ncbi:TIGR02444 family protein [Alkalilimnicola sp. S0819]|uniref:TIGR02444 family protein n=1 Tax=Alkalilimnicola sp. S0819 TaxID=2613922 RepID=UPI00126166D7|nr:TIGR02444 family protein [Alkalilimnicola sp. S0819]KAB7623989.1 TIGR02444 family protein [Alkalilimnicola sp. S0819]MPQ16593.1 TIGR02444 family protein [Alkalilimnicola sp. S0819]
MNQDTAARELWNFAVAVYERDGVKAACLRVQARYGVSISTLFAAVWTGSHGYGRLGATELEDTARRATEWHRDVIQPIRALRRQLRQQPPQGVEDETYRLRKQLLERELDAERIEQKLFLMDFPQGLPCAPIGERWRDASHNAVLLMRKYCPRAEAEAVEDLSLILQAACPGRSVADLQAETARVWRGA